MPIPLTFGKYRSAYVRSPMFKMRSGLWLAIRSIVWDAFRDWPRSPTNAIFNGKAGVLLQVWK